MLIIQIEANPSGAYPSVQSWDGDLPPCGYREIAADTTEYFNGFIIPMIENDIVVSFVCNTTAREAWKAEEAAKAVIVPTDTKAIALNAIEKATTIASLRTAMLNYIDVAGIG